MGFPLFPLNPMKTQKTDKEKEFSLCLRRAAPEDSTRELLFLSMILYGYFFSPMTTHSSFSRWYGVPQFGHCRRCMASKLAAQVLQFTAWMEKP